jgi:hypothetical protein
VSDRASVYQGLFANRLLAGQDHYIVVEAARKGMGLATVTLER